MNKKFESLGTVLSRDEAKMVRGGIEVSCHCMEGGIVGVTDCETCVRYCSTRGGQASTSDCCPLGGSNT